jgi:hypothetical protein
VGVHSCNPSTWEAEAKIVKLRPDWATQGDPLSTKQTEEENKQKKKHSESHVDKKHKESHITS